MKKILLISVIICLVVCLFAACNNSTSEPIKTDVQQADVDEVTETPKEFRSAYIAVVRNLIDQYCEKGLVIPDDSEWGLYDFPEGVTSVTVQATRSNGNGDFINCGITMKNGTPTVHYFEDVNGTYVDDGLY